MLLGVCSDHTHKIKVTLVPNFHHVGYIGQDIPQDEFRLANFK